MWLRIGLLFILAGVNIWAETVPVPGRLATASDIRAFPADSASELTSVSPPKHRLLTGIWLGSMAAMVGATALDAGTSWGKREANGFLASGNGTFGAKGLAIKSSLSTAILVPEILFRKHKEAKIAAILGNFTQAAVFSTVSVHNLGVAGPR